MFLPPAERNMRTFLGMLMVLIVSGDEETITGIIEDSVLLPCNCSEINFDKEFKWQMEKPIPKLVLKYNNISEFNGTYKGRGKTFLEEAKNNCSILLTKITPNDQGKYSCRFHRFVNHENLYTKFYINLTVSASYNLCQKNASDADLRVKVFQCDVSGHYEDAEIQWILDGQILTNSSTTNITNSNFMNLSTGRYEFHSKLTTQLNTSKPTCHVKAKGISTIINYDCHAVDWRISKDSKENGKPNYKMRYFKVISIMLVLGLCLVLWRRWKSSRSSPRIREAGADSSYY